MKGTMTCGEYRSLAVRFRQLPIPIQLCLHDHVDSCLHCEEWLAKLVCPLGGREAFKDYVKDKRVK